MNPKGRTYFLANVCHVCKSKNTSYACEICRMIYYCSLEHKRTNWFEHSELCWAINKICNSGQRCDSFWDLYDGRDFTKFRHEMAIKCSELMKRNLKSWEMEMIYHPRVCNVCRNWKNLTLCKDCEFVYTCEKNHFRKDHGKWCETMKIYSDLIIDLSLGDSFDVGLPELVITNESDKSMAGILERNDEFENEKVRKALTSELLTYPLTVFHGLKTIDSLRERKLIVLMIGAEVQAEVEPLIKWEKYLLHSLPETELLHLKFLGPELWKNDEEFFGNSCETCRKQRKNIKFQFISKKFYHECSSSETERPNLICAFNSGMYRDFGFGKENSWEETILKLFARGNPPVIITEYTRRELEMVLEKIRGFHNDVTQIVPLGIYINVLHACALNEDIDFLPCGDDTEIGERGVNLSGGQKQRVSLARALYSDKDIYFLDDPFSAVDPQVAVQIFEKYVLENLAKKTVVLVTRQIHWLQKCDEIIVMKIFGLRT